MLPSFPAILALTIPLSPAAAKVQNRAVSYSTQVMVQLTVAREPRPKQPDEKASTAPTAPVAPAAPQAPLASRTFTGLLQLRSPDSARIAAYDDKRTLRQVLTINSQTAVLWQ
jgi:hypothetical protein